MGKNKPFHEKTYLNPSKRHAMIDNLLSQLEHEKELYAQGFAHYESMKDLKGFDGKSWMMQQFLYGKSMATLAFLNQEFDTLMDAYRHIVNEIQYKVGMESIL